MEEQIKSERRWWQEHLLQEVARIEATVSKEISKSTSALREHLQLQMEEQRMVIHTALSPLRSPRHRRPVSLQS
ncbi:unnamed protein product [Prorocentrum cordatum]|uniref:Centrosomal protein POC5 n=1 Tax=Prorocentrum cordatum TaxID=2364126 RepID=A0ABN9UGE6_9DINO|nr:unnamed protein product [Polarella glacialis]